MELRSISLKGPHFQSASQIVSEDVSHLADALRASARIARRELRSRTRSYEVSGLGEKRSFSPQPSEGRSSLREEIFLHVRKTGLRPVHALRAWALATPRFARLRLRAE